MTLPSPQLCLFSTPRVLPKLLPKLLTMSTKLPLSSVILAVSKDLDSVSASENDPQQQPGARGSWARLPKTPSLGGFCCRWRF